MLRIKEDTLVYAFDGEKVVIEAWGPNALRVQASCSSVFPVENWALAPQSPGGQSAGAAETDGQTGWIRNGKITAKINKSGKLTFYNQQGGILLEEYARNFKDFAGNVEASASSGFVSPLNINAREWKPILGGDYELTVRFESRDERLYGMGQYQQPFLNIKGCELELAQRNSQASVPFAVSSLGYGFLWNNPAVGRVSFARNVTTWSVRSTKFLDYWITAGDTPAEILRNYAAATGTAPMMPDWAMGFWQCKLRYESQEELLEVARKYKRLNVPLSVIVADFFHWTKQGEWKFEPKYWPDPKAMVDELEAMGVKLVVSVWPTVERQSENWSEMEEKGFLVRADRGPRIGMTFMADTMHCDMTNPHARVYLWGKIKQNLYDCGVRAFWLDEAEPEYTVYDFDLYRYSIGPVIQIGNIYPLMYAKAFYEGMTAEGQGNILNLLRCAWAGSQRYGALVWSGDIDSSFASMRRQLAAGLNMGLAGIPWWTTDIGGFHGGNPSDPGFRECFARWFAWGAFCPVMRVHGDRQPHKEPQAPGLPASGADNEIWSYGPEIQKICEKYIAIRMRMKPYLTQIMAETHKTGIPVMRPLFFDFPDDPRAWEIEDAYMFGPDILVAPVLYERTAVRDVYLPAGVRWKDAWTGETFLGGTVCAVETPLDKIPLFIRETSGSPLQFAVNPVASGV
ncbi:MAG: glycoside hydrolase family 31 protein [Clostridiales bacterium]|jgi:alpha-D-xyloside xylohydrolase|nr:glycoside hydrolase family 31 protein [Clostridiales bacterium]